MGSPGDWLGGRLARGLHGGLQAMGLDLKRYSPANDPHLRRQRILVHHRIDQVIDGGANEGQYGLKLRQNGYTGRILSLEPGSEAYAKLALVAAARAPWDTLQLALAQTPGEALLRLTENSVSSSILPGTKDMGRIPGSREVATETVPVTTLDAVAANEIPAGKRLLVKLDVQGSERSALEGGLEALARARLLEIELACVDLYQGQSSALELWNWLDSKDYELISMTPNTLDAASGQVLEFDAIFANQSHRT